MLVIYKKMRNQSESLTPTEEKKYVRDLILTGMTTGMLAIFFMIGEVVAEKGVDYLGIPMSRTVAGMIGAGTGCSTGGFCMGLLDLFYQLYENPDKIDFYAGLLKICKDSPGTFFGAGTYYFAETWGFEAFVSTALYTVLTASPFSPIAGPASSILARVLKSAMAASAAYAVNSGVDIAAETLHKAVNELLVCLGYKTYNEEKNLEDPEELRQKDLIEEEGNLDTIEIVISSGASIQESQEENENKSKDSSFFSNLYGCSSFGTTVYEH
jgi:hypothetical protein